MENTKFYNFNAQYLPEPYMLHNEIIFWRKTYYCSFGEYCKRLTEHCKNGKLCDGSIVKHTYNLRFVCRNYSKGICEKHKKECNYLHVDIICGSSCCEYFKTTGCKYWHENDDACHNNATDQKDIANIRISLPKNFQSKSREL